MPFPTPDGHIKLPISSRSAAIAGVALLPACRPAAVVIQRLMWYGVRVLGARALPWRPETWQRPTTDEVWNELMRQWSAAVGRIDSIVISERRQHVRTGISVLLVRDGETKGLVRLRRGTGEAFLGEQRALNAIESFRPRTFTAPTVLACGSAAEWSWVAFTAHGGLHSVPRQPPLRDITGEISEALSSLPRPALVRDRWMPMHGDLTPWNMRQLPSGQLVIFDWEDAGWGPPGADLTLYRASCCALYSRKPQGSFDTESIEFWRERLAARAADTRTDVRLHQAMSLVLDRMQQAHEDVTSLGCA